MTKFNFEVVDICLIFSCKCTIESKCMFVWKELVSSGIKADLCGLYQECDQSNWNRAPQPRGSIRWPIEYLLREHHLGVDRECHQSMIRSGGHLWWINQDHQNNEFTTGCRIPEPSTKRGRGGRDRTTHSFGFTPSS